MKETIEANLNARAIEKIRDPKKPDMALFSLSCRKVRGKGLVIGVILILLPPLRRFI